MMGLHFPVDTLYNINAIGYVLHFTTFTYPFLLSKYISLKYNSKMYISFMDVEVEPNIFFSSTKWQKLNKIPQIKTVIQKSCLLDWKMKELLEERGNENVLMADI